MPRHEPYDQERYVRQNETYDEPTEQIQTRGVVRRRRGERVVEDDDRDTIVREDAVVERPTRFYGYEADDVREDVSIDHVVARRALLDRVSSAIWFVVGLLEVAIALRIVFLLLDANTGSGFVQFIYGLTNPFVAPFEGIFYDPAVDEGGYLDTAGLMAMVIWAFLAWAVVRLLWILLDYPESGVRRSVRERHRDRI